MAYADSKFDLWSVVNRVRTAISSIRQKERANRKLQKAMDIKEKYSRKKAIYEELKSLSDDSRELKAIDKYYANVSKELEECIKEIDALQKTIVQLDAEINEHIKYMDLFSHFDYEDYKYLMDNREKRNRYIWEAIILLALNHGICEEEREKIRNELHDYFLKGDFLMFNNKDADLREEFINGWLISNMYLYSF